MAVILTCAKEHIVYVHPYQQAYPVLGGSMRRYGQIIGVKPEHIESYEQLHARVWPEVLVMIESCHMHNYTIFRHGTLLFAYFEYSGDDFSADMRRMAQDPKTQEWWSYTDLMQEPVADRPNGEWWATMHEIFHND